MTGEELQEAIRKLRAFAAAQGMQWVLDEADDAIALGVPETRTLRQTSRLGLVTYEDITAEPFFIANLQAQRIQRYLTALGRNWENGVIPGSREANFFVGQLREAFKKYQSREGRLD
jgi:hypothetical protein